VMLHSFFGLHPYVARSWLRMTPVEKDLYIFLMAEKERRCRREIRATDPWNPSYFRRDRSSGE